MGPAPSPSLQGHSHARELQSPWLAACESGLEENAITIHELTFCYYLVLKPGVLLACWGSRRNCWAGRGRGEEKLST